MNYLAGLFSGKVVQAFTEQEAHQDTIIKLILEPFSCVVDAPPGVGHLENLVRCHGSQFNSSEDSPVTATIKPLSSNSEANSTFSQGHLLDQHSLLARSRCLVLCPAHLDLYNFYLSTSTMENVSQQFEHKYQIMRNVAGMLVALDEAKFVIDGDCSCIPARHIKVRARKIPTSPIERLKEQHIAQPPAPLGLGHKHLHRIEHIEAGWGMSVLRIVNIACAGMTAHPVHMDARVLGTSAM